MTLTALGTVLIKILLWVVADLFICSFNCDFDKVKLRFVDVEKMHYFVLEFSLLPYKKYMSC